MGPSYPQNTPTTTQFLAHVYGGQTAGWMKTAFGTEVDLGPGHFVLDGFPVIGKRGTAAPLFSAHTYCGHVGRPYQLKYPKTRDVPGNKGRLATLIVATVAHLSYC